MATDFSGSVVRHLLDHLTAIAGGKGDVRVLQRTADNFEGFEKNSFDTVIINSVVQYFPGIEYLIKVLEQAVEVVMPGGTVFIGDVRSLPLLDDFYRSVAVFQEPAMHEHRLKQKVAGNLNWKKSW